MKPARTRRSPLQNVPEKPRVLVQLIFGSVALHLLILWVAIRLPAPPVKAPEITTEVELSESPAPTVVASRPQFVPAVRPKASPKISAKPARIEQPRPTPRENLPSAPLVRSMREVAKTRIDAQKPVEPRPTAALPAPISPILRAPDAILPKAKQSGSPAKTQTKKIARLPSVSANQKQQSANKNGTEQDSGSAKKARAIAKADLKAENLVTSNPTQSGKTSPLGKGSQNRANENGKTQNATGLSNPKNGGNGQKTGEVSSTANGNDDGGNPRGGANTNSLGGGPFGTNGGAGEGPRRIVYILDISYSMEPRLERAKKELAQALDGLQPGESFNIIGFYGNVIPFNRGLVEATPDNIAKGRAVLDSLRLKRNTNLELAFETTFAARGINVVVLITDGVPTYGLGSPDFTLDKPDIGANFGELAQRVRQLNVTKARIYTVGLVGKNPDGTDASFEVAALLKRISRESGGTFKVVRIDAAPQSNSR